MAKKMQSPHFFVDSNTGDFYGASRNAEVVKLVDTLS